MTNQPTPKEFRVCTNLETQLDITKETDMNAIIAQTQSVELDGTITKAATITAREAEYDAEDEIVNLEAELEDLQGRIDSAITAMRSEARGAVFELLRDKLADFWRERLDDVITEFVRDSEINMKRIDDALLEPEDLDIDSYADFVDYGSRARLGFATEIELSDYEYDFRELVEMSAATDYTKISSCLIQLYVCDAVSWSGAFIKGYIENN